MIYHYIFGRTDSSRGLDVIKHDDDGRYSGDSKLRTALDVELDKPDGYDICPVPTVFVNNPGDKEITAIGKLRLVYDGRSSKLDHFYLFDNERGSHRDSLFEETSLIFAGRRYAETPEEAKLFDTPADQVLQSGSEVYDNDLPDRGVLEALLPAAFDAAAKGRHIYIIMSGCSQEQVDKNALLVKLLYSVMPGETIRQLGFITYFKHISVYGENRLNENIRLRFVEDNASNRKAAGAIESGGDFVLNIPAGTYPKRKLNQNGEDFLSFLIQRLGKPKDGELERFFNFINERTESRLAKTFGMYTDFYGYWLSIKSDDVSIDTAEKLLDYYQLFNGMMKNEYKTHVFQRIGQNARYFTDSALAANKYCAKVYERIGDLKQDAARLIAGSIEPGAKSVTDYLMKDIGCSNKLYEHVSRLLFNEPAFKKTGLKLFRELFELAAKGAKPLDKLFSILDMLSVVNNSSSNILNEIDISDYYTEYISGPVKELDRGQFIKLAGKMANLRDIKVVEEFYMFSCMGYLTRSISLQEEAALKSKEFFDIFEIICEKNKNVLNKQVYRNYYVGFFEDLLRNAITEKKLPELNAFWERTESFAQRFGDRTYITDDRAQIVEAALSIHAITEGQIIYLAEWPDHFIEMLLDKHLKQKVIEMKKKQDIEKLIQCRQFSKLKAMLNDEAGVNKDPYIMHELKSWHNTNIEKVKSSQVDKSYYELLPLILESEGIMEIMRVMPRDNIGPWQSLLSGCTDDNLNNYAHAIKNAIENDNNLLKALKHLPDSERARLEARIGKISTHPDAQKEDRGTASGLKKAVTAMLAVYFAIGVLSYLLIAYFNGLSGADDKLWTAMFSIISAVAAAAASFFAYRKNEYNLNTASKKNCLAGLIILMTFSIIVSAFHIIAGLASNPVAAPETDFYRRMYLIQNPESMPEVTITKIQAADRYGVMYDALPKGGNLTVQTEKPMTIQFAAANASGLADIYVAVNDAKQYTEILYQSDILICGTVTIETQGLESAVVVITALNKSAIETVAVLNIINEKIPLPEITAFEVFTYKVNADGGSTDNRFDDTSEFGTLSVAKGERVTVTIEVSCEVDANISLALNGELIPLDEYRDESDPNKYNSIEIPSDLLADTTNELKATAKISGSEKEILLHVNLLE